MTRILFFFFLFLLLTSCYYENKLEEQQPDPFLTEEQIIEVLTDIQTAEAIIAYNRLQRENTDQEYKDSLFKVVFDHYGMTAEEINANLEYYNNNPEQMERIYEKVLSNLSRRQSEVEEESKSDTTAVK
jgi:hypothetical protein